MTALTNKQYTSSVGQKFNPDGSPREFHGNTVIFHVPTDSATFDLLLRIRKETESQRWARKFSFLPPSSYHMTIFEGVCDQVREPAKWTSKLPLDAPLERVDDLLRQAWPDVSIPRDVSMSYRLYNAAIGNISIYVKANTHEMERKLRSYHDKLSEAFGIRASNHDNYAFHITLAYRIEMLTISETFQAICFSRRMHRDLRRSFGTLQINTPKLTFFADMTCFAPTRPEFPVTL